MKILAHDIKRKSFYLFFIFICLLSCKKNEETPAIEFIEPSKTTIEANSPSTVNLKLKLTSPIQIDSLKVADKVADADWRLLKTMTFSHPSDTATFTSNYFIPQGFEGTEILLKFSLYDKSKPGVPYAESILTINVK